MASVYQARDELLGRQVAIKVYRSTALSQSDVEVQEAEIRTVAGLNHPSLVTVLDAGVYLPRPDMPTIFLVMELLEGENLHQRIQRRKLTSHETALVGYDIAEGLNYLGDRGVVHRDVKPGNILLVTYGTSDTRLRSKLIDFGIAKRDGQKETMTPGQTTGTAPYLSPEQASGEPITPASDVYSLGLVLLECLTGERAFPGESIPAAVARLMHDPVIPETLPEEWRTVLAAMTARLPSERPSLREVVLLLRDIVVGAYVRRPKAGDGHRSPEEDARMRTVDHYAILDTPPDEALDRITAMAARAFNAPISIVSIVDHDRIWFKSHHGLDVEEIDREPGLCSSAILGDGAWVVENARLDPRTLANSLVTGDFGLQFYAGVPLKTREGHNLGTLCVIDTEPKQVTQADLATLSDLAAVVVRELERRLEPSPR
jgi:serine/threonine protein kinase